MLCYSHCGPIIAAIIVAAVEDAAPAPVFEYFSPAPAERATPAPGWLHGVRAYSVRYTHTGLSLSSSRQQQSASRQVCSLHQYQCWSTSRLCLQVTPQLHLSLRTCGLHQWVHNTSASRGVHLACASWVRNTSTSGEYIVPAWADTPASVAACRWPAPVRYAAPAPAGGFISPAPDQSLGTCPICRSDYAAPAPVVEAWPWRQSWPHGSECTLGNDPHDVSRACETAHSTMKF